jgi:hypothetical protein
MSDDDRRRRRIGLGEIVDALGPTLLAAALILLLAALAIWRFGGGTP